MKKVVKVDNTSREKLSALYTNLQSSSQTLVGDSVMSLRAVMKKIQTLLIVVTP